MTDTEARKATNKLTGWILAFLVPFLAVAIPVGYHWYCYQSEDISWRHPGAFNYESPDSVAAKQSCWESAILFGPLFGAPVGLLGITGYGIFRFTKRKKDKLKAG